MALNINRSLLRLVQTALFIALIVAVQFVTQSMTQFVTGSAVNLILIVATMLVHPLSGAGAALLSPITAFLFGIGPQIAFVPVIMLGNLAIVAVFGVLLRFADRRSGALRYTLYGVTVLLGALAKFAVLYIGINKIVVPMLTLQAPQIEKFAYMFGYPQIITALIGGVLAVTAVPLVRRALRKTG